MRRSRFTERQVVSILKEADAGASVKDIYRRHGISSATWYQWNSKYGGMSTSELNRTKELDAELGQMKRMYANLALENRELKVLPHPAHRGDKARRRTGALAPGPTCRTGPPDPG